MSKARQLAERFSQTSSGIKFQLALADLYLERGWGIAAIQVLQRILPTLRYPIRNGETENGSIPWSTVKTQQDTASLRDQSQKWRQLVRDEAWQTEDDDDLIAQVLTRAIDATAMCDVTADRAKLLAMDQSGRHNLAERTSKANPRPTGCGVAMEAAPKTKF